MALDEFTQDDDLRALPAFSVYKALAPTAHPLQSELELTLAPAVDLTVFAHVMFMITGLPRKLLEQIS